MSDLIWLFAICLLGAEAWLRRQQSELAEQLIKQYCQRNQWQFVSVARSSLGTPLILANILRRPNAFVFEFSQDGLNQLESEFFLTGLQQPVFRDIPRWQPPARDGEIIEHQPDELKADNVIQFPVARPKTSQQDKK